MELKNKLRELRARERLTQDDLAKMVQVSRQTIVSMEKGSYTPSLTLAMNIARVFGMAVEEIFYFEEEEHEKSAH